MTNIQLFECLDEQSTDEKVKQNLLVYTDYGYGNVDIAKFQEQLEKMGKESTELEETIREYFLSQHEELVATAKAADEEAAAKRKKEDDEAKAAEEKKAAEAEADKKLAEDSKDKVEEAAAAGA